MAKATWVPISYLSERGQQIKVFSQMTRKARELGFMVPTIRWGQATSEKYEGATVLEAQTGAYYAPITALDFEGLYPSIMIAHNLCYSTLVMDERYANIPGVTYETFGAHKFAQDVPSLLPAILVELKQFRKKAKQDMATATGDMKKVYNGKQLAYKISMNSVYGFTGAGKGMLPCVPIASTVTMKGRSMIDDTKKYVEDHFPGSKVRYGDTDSVMVEFDVQGRTGQEAIAYSWELGERAAEVSAQRQAEGAHQVLRLRLARQLYLEPAVSPQVERQPLRRHARANVDGQRELRRRLVDGGLADLLELGR
jgi:DNA polymerase delta subunit 1